MTRVKIKYENDVFDLKPVDARKGGGKTGRVKVNSGRCIRIKFPGTAHISLSFTQNSLVKHLNANFDAELKKGWFFGYGGSSQDKVENAFLNAYGRDEDLYRKAEHLEGDGKMDKAIRAYHLAAKLGHLESITKLQELDLDP